MELTYEIHCAHVILYAIHPTALLAAYAFYHIFVTSLFGFAGSI